ncbi:MAG TPA: hypothetical protein ENK55_03950 [Actinobacteria bacterium]|nr:hypothetical protein [Actinomycetota bacterium]
MTAQETPIVPDFGEDASERKMAFVASKGTLDMAYPPLVMANAALGEGIETHIFFTFWGLDIVTKKVMADLKFTPMANPATHIPQALTPLPGMTAMATHQMHKMLEELDIPDIPEFLDLIVDAGGHLWACKLSVDMMKLTPEDLYDGVEGIISATDFIELIEGAQTMFI